MFQHVCKRSLYAIGRLAKMGFKLKRPIIIFVLLFYAVINMTSIWEVVIYQPEVLRIGDKSLQNGSSTAILENVTVDYRFQKTSVRQYKIGKYLRHGTSWNANVKNGTCIAAILLVRIYRGDKPELTTYETEQWIRYLQYAGVDIIYLYDAYENEWEKLEHWVNKLFSPSEVVYHDWHKNTPYEMVKTQVSAYVHATKQYKYTCRWHFAIDIDEYPFVLDDKEPGFLKRLVSNFSNSRPQCTELSFRNFIFSGYPKESQWLPARILRRTPSRSNSLDKPLYIAENIRTVGIHHNSLKHGISCDVDESVARLNHYWGARTQHWMPDTEGTLSKTIQDESILPILKHLQKISLISNKIPANVTNRFWNDTFAGSKIV